MSNVCATSSRMHMPAYNHGSTVLQTIGWKPDPTGMFKAPSLAKNSPARAAFQQLGLDATFRKNIQFAACVEHLAAIGGSHARKFLLSPDCRLSRKQIEGLGRRVPPFITAKLEEVMSGGRFEGNPTQAFDTNGWGELRGRLPKFRSTLQHYAGAIGENDLHELSKIERTRIRDTSDSIIAECDLFLAKLRSFVPCGAGKAPAVTSYSPIALKWVNAWAKLRAVLGVLEKCNRDLNSPYWRREWIPTHDDLIRVTEIAEVMKSSAREISRAVAVDG